MALRFPHPPGTGAKTPKVARPKFDPAALLFTTKTTKPKTALATLHASIIIEVRKRTFKYLKHRWSDLHGQKFPLSKLAQHIDDAKACINKHL